MPHGADFKIPEISQQKVSCMGYLVPVPGKKDKLTLGYGSDLISEGYTTDAYRIYTYVWEIYANILGQRVGPYNYPKSAINPYSIEFQYGYVYFDWGQ